MVTIPHGTSSPQAINPADIRVSLLTERFNPLKVSRLPTLGEIMEEVRTSKDLTETTARARTFKAAGNTDAYDRTKRELPSVVPAACAPPGTALKGLPPDRWHNSLYGYDIDEGDALELQALRDTLITAPGAVVVARSAGGEGLWALFLGPKASTIPEYKAFWRAILDTFPEGVKAASGAQSVNFNRERYLASDPHAWLATELVTPLEITPESVAPRYSHPHTTPGLASFHEQRAIDLDALWSFPAPGQGQYNQWFSWLPRLKALGFTVEEADEWSKTGDGYEPGVVAAKWATLPVDAEEEARNKLWSHAYTRQGWRHPKATWAPGDAVSPPLSAAPPPGSAGDNGRQAGILSLDHYGSPTSVSGKTAKGLREALDHLEVGLRFNIRAMQPEFNLKGKEWARPNDRSKQRLREVIKDRYVYYNRGGEAQRLNFGKDTFDDMLNVLLYDQEVDPFLAWLEALPKWDKEERLATWLGHVFKISRYQEIGAWASRFMFLGPVWRAYHPGWKLDEVPVLMGPGGVGKSTTVQFMLPLKHRAEWFGELNLAWDMKRRVECLQGRVLVELGDMAGASKAEREELKTFITQANDGIVRLTWRRDPETLLRRCVFVGTSDSDTPLPNDDNLRRWVPVFIDKASPGPAKVRKYLDENRTQLWAEARHLYHEGVDARLEGCLEPMQAEATGEARSRDQALDDAVREWLLEGHPGFTTKQAAEGIKMVNPDEGARLLNRDSQRLIAVLTTAGWKRERRQEDGQRDWRWYPS